MCVPSFTLKPHKTNYMVWVTGDPARQQVGALMPSSVMLMLTALALLLQPLISSVLQSAKLQPADFFFFSFFFLSLSQMSPALISLLLTHLKKKHKKRRVHHSSSNNLFFIFCIQLAL